MSDLVARARAALDGVTPGPWETSCRPWPTQIGCCPLVGNPRSAHHKMLNVAAANTDKDIRFIAAARSLVPDMADRIEALEAENARLRDALRRIVSTSQAMSADYICNGGESGHERTARIAFAALTPETSHD